MAGEAKKWDDALSPARGAAIDSLRSELTAILETMDRLQLPLSAVHIQTALEALSEQLRQD